MIKTVENKFFEPFKPGGIVQRCIEYVREEYNLYTDTIAYQNRAKIITDGIEYVREKYKINTDWSDIQKDAQNAIQVLQNIDDTVLTPLFDEIEDNLNECRSDEQRERYVIFSLLKPFTTCGLAKLFFPLSKLEYLVDCIDEQKQYLPDIPEDIKYEFSDKAEEEITELIKKEIDDTNTKIAEYKAEFEREEENNSRFIDLLENEDVINNDYAFKYLRCLYQFVADIYAKRLELLLVSFSMSVFRLQKLSGFYITDIDGVQMSRYIDYYGSPQIALYYVEKTYGKQIMPYSFEYVKCDDYFTLNCAIYSRFRGEEPQTDDAPSSRENVLQIKKQRGRPQKTIKECFLNITYEQWQRVKDLAKEKTGVDFIMVIKATMELNWITTPSHPQIVREFGEVCSDSQYTEYIKNNKFIREDIERIKAVLLRGNMT